MSSNDYTIKQTTFGELKVNDIIHTPVDSYYVKSIDTDPGDEDSVVAELQSVDDHEGEEILTVKQLKTRTVTALIDD